MVADFPELHDEVHETAGGAQGLRLALGAGRLDQVLYGDLVLDGLVQQALARRQRTVHKDFNLNNKT